MNQPSSKPVSRLRESVSVEPIILDCDHILTHAGGDPELLIRLCSVFLNELPMRTECMGVAIKDRNKIASERALQQLRNCLIIFGSCEVFATMEMLQAAVRGGRLRQVKREWNRFESQVRILIPQVQQLMLEMSTPKSAVQ